MALPLPLFTGVRRRGILRSSDAGLRIERPLEPQGASLEAFRVVREASICCIGG